MLKLTKSIIDSKRNLIGFVVTGKEKEFGGFSNQVISRGMPIAQIIAQRFNNSQITVICKDGERGKIVERNNFKINQMEMVMFNPSTNEYTNIDNTVNLIGRFVQNNENIGFRLRFFDGSEDNMTYKTVIELCRWFKPGNFSIRTSSKGNVYICGKKGGIGLDELPATVLGEQSEAKRTKSAAKEKKVTFNGAIENEFDILDIYEFIQNCGGCIINLPNEKYVAATEGGDAESEGFVSLGIGEVGSAYPAFNATKLNVNADFKKVGVVPVSINGTTQNITTFVFRKKSVFLKGENYIKKFGIAVPVDKADELIKVLGKSLAIEEIKDTTITAPLGAVIDAKSLAFFKVDSSKIDLLSEKKRAASIMTSKQIAELCKKQFELKLISKAVGPKGPIQKECKDLLSSADAAKAKGLSLKGIFSMMSPEALEAITNAGIDVYTGAYTVAKTYTPKKAGTGSGDEVDESVEIEYTLNGYDPGKLTGAKVIDAVKANDKTKVTANVIKYVSKVLSVADPAKRYNLACELYDTVEKELKNISKTLWMHNASMYLAGNKTKIHTHDSADWSLDENTRIKTGTVYANKAVPGLTVKVKGVTI